MSEQLLACAEGEKITRICAGSSAFEDVLRLRALALPQAMNGATFQDAFDAHANIYLLRQAGRPVLTLRTIHANATPHCEMESLYPVEIMRKYRDLVMHTSRLARHPDTKADHRQLVRFMAHVFAQEYAHGIRITFATSPIALLGGYRALGFAIVKNSSFSFLETRDESRLIVQAAVAGWRSPFAAKLDRPKSNSRPRHSQMELLSDLQRHL